MLSRLFFADLWSPAGKGLTSWLLFVMFNCVFVTFPCGILGQVWRLIVRKVGDIGAQAKVEDIGAQANLEIKLRICRINNLVFS